MEVCVDNWESAKNAELGGAMRIELCSSLSEGGLSPSPGFARLAKEKLSIPIFPMIRCRGGNFVYSEEEMEIMLHDLQIFKDIGVDGLVFGALKDGNIDIKSCKMILEAAGKLPVTFHRAFDEVANPRKTFDQLIQLGFKRLLTSGQKPTAIEGIELIKELNENGNLIVMPGSGVNINNVSEILKTGVIEFHGSAKVTRNINGHNIAITDKNLVQEMVKVYNEIHN